MSPAIIEGVAIQAEYLGATNSAAPVGAAARGIRPLLAVLRAGATFDAGAAIRERGSLLCHGEYGVRNLHAETTAAAQCTPLGEVKVEAPVKFMRTKLRIVGTINTQETV